MKPARINDRSNIMTLVWGVNYGSRGEVCITTCLDDDSGRRTKRMGTHSSIMEYQKNTASGSICTGEVSWLVP